MKKRSLNIVTENLEISFGESVDEENSDQENSEEENPDEKNSNEEDD